jgi:hypothetical protein
MKLIRNVITATKIQRYVWKVPLPSRYGRFVDSTINTALRAKINDNKIQFFFVTLNNTVDNTNPKRIRATDSAISTLETTMLNQLKFCTPLTNLIKMFGIETRVLSYEAHRTTLSTILRFNLLKSAGLSEAHTQK